MRVRRLARSARATARGLARACLGRKPRGVSIIGLHKVSDAADPLPLTLTPGYLECVLEYLAKKHGFVSMDELADDPGRVLQSPLRYAVTFDDGYRNNFEIAWPILRSLSIPAIIYVSLDHVDGKRTFWYERLAALFSQRAPRRSLDLRAATAGVHDDPSPPKLRRLHLELNDSLKTLPDEEREATIDRLLADNDCAGAASITPMLTWDMIREMGRKGVSIGSHTVSHCILSRETVARVESELAESKRRLESELGVSVHHLAYPNGRAQDVSPEVVEVARLSGYRTAVTTQVGSNGRDANLLLLRRVNLHTEAVSGVFGFSRAVLDDCFARHWSETMPA